jgi:hypothetical protein
LPESRPSALTDTALTGTARQAKPDVDMPDSAMQATVIPVVSVAARLVNPAE